jgi:hypothetical protein
MLGSAMEQLGKRVLVKRTADSDLARAYAGQTGEIMMFTKSPETMVLMSYTIRLDNGEHIELAPSEVEILS